MHGKNQAFRPQATELEAKLLLSLTATPAPETAEVSLLSSGGGAAAVPAPTTGAIAGRYFAAEDNRAADAPLHVLLNGTGRVAGLGRVKLAGSLDLGGFRRTGSNDVTGTLTLSNARGTVTLRLTGSGGFAEVPNGQFVTAASIVRGTGAFASFRRIGTVTVNFGESLVRSIQAPSPIGGAMTVSLTLRPPVR